MTAPLLRRHIDTLFPLFRSITGDGVRATLRYIGGYLPLTTHEVPTGTSVLDWTVPPEWNVTSAKIRTLDGRTVVDFADNNLHLLHYSTPVDRVVSRAELDGHLHSLPAQPGLIPYRTAYYAGTWGFCLAHQDRLTMTDDAYHVTIDTELTPGSLSYGESVLPGREPSEFLVSVHCCHPAMANDNLSGLAVAIEAAQALQRRPGRRLTVRFVFAPATIGAITWLARNRDTVGNVRHGLVVSCLGDPALPTYKRSRRGDARIDRYVAHLFRAEGNSARIQPFTPDGYDERQYCSPGFNLPVGCLMRSPNSQFPYYHTSADNLSFVQDDSLADSLRLLLAIIDMADADQTWINTRPFGEPQLGRRGLYAKLGGQADGAAASGTFDKAAMMWVLNFSDGDHSVLDIAEQSGLPFAAIAAAATRLHASGLLRPASADTAGAPRP